MKNYARFTLGLVIAWFVLALTASSLHLFQNNDNRIGLAVAFAAGTPICGVLRCGLRRRRIFDASHYL